MTFGLTRFPQPYVCGPLPMTRGKLCGQAQQHKPFRSKDLSELLSFTSWVQPAIKILLMLSVTAANMLLHIWANIWAHFLREEGTRYSRRGKERLARGCLYRSCYWGLFAQTERQFLARNWKDFSGVLASRGRMLSIVDSCTLAQLVERKGGYYCKTRYTVSDILYKFWTSVWCYV